MYFELIPNSVDDSRFNSDHGVSIHMCCYDEDRKGRRIIGSPMTNDKEVDQKIDTLICELEEIRRNAKQFVRNGT